MPFYYLFAWLSFKVDPTPFRQDKKHYKQHNLKHCSSEFFMKIHRTFKNHKYPMLVFVQIHKAIINYIYFPDTAKSSQCLGTIVILPHVTFRMLSLVNYFCTKRAHNKLLYININTLLNQLVIFTRHITSKYLYLYINILKYFHICSPFTNT